ncbi:MAG: DUF1349 domain-containing protein [Anaerolineae bacterium]|nr:DUF1349 domain-containing protein [Anaerolineae bacterium]
MADTTQPVLADFEGVPPVPEAGAEEFIGDSPSLAPVSSPHSVLSLPVVYNRFRVLGPGFSDEFDGALSHQWRWTDPNDDATHSVTARPGYLLISAPAGNDLHPNFNYDAPRLLQLVEGDFEVETALEFSPRRSYQGAGILVWQDLDNFARLEMGYYEDRRVILFDKEEVGWYQHVTPPAAHPVAADLVELKLRRYGNRLSAWWRWPGGHWQAVGSTTLRLRRQVWVGLALIAEHHAPQTTAYFDKFRVSSVEPLNYPRLYFTTGYGLYELDLTTYAVTTLQQTTWYLSSEHTAVDMMGTRVYISRWPEQILAYDIMADTLEQFVTTPGGGGQGIAVDVPRGRLFYGTYYGGVYTTLLNNPGEWTQLVTSENIFPLHGQRGQLQVDPVGQHVYFRTPYNGECGDCRWIWRVGYDGRGLERIVKANGGDALDLDPVERKLYFSDWENDRVRGEATIKWAAMEPNAFKHTLYTVRGPYNFCRHLHLDLKNRKIYLNLYNLANNYQDRAIARLNMDGTGFEILYTIHGGSEYQTHGAIALFIP